jgi:hypothetical protein
MTRRKGKHHREMVQGDLMGRYWVGQCYDQGSDGRFCGSTVGHYAWEMPPLHLVYWGSPLGYKYILR